MANSFIQRIKSGLKDIEYNPVKAFNDLHKTREEVKQITDNYVNMIIPKSKYEQDMGANYRRVQNQYFKKVIKNKKGNGIVDGDKYLKEQKEMVDKQKEEFDSNN